ncbi:MAG: hydantoinase/oxoprolinase family protein [Candidatus Acidiferrales bacterium]
MHSRRSRISTPHQSRSAEILTSLQHFRCRAGVDVGGTFTDVIVVNDETGAFAIGKTLTTPSNPSEAIETTLRETLQKVGSPSDGLQALVHGTTLVTNALIERKGDRTALLATRGFRDAIEIGRESRYDLYDLTIDLPRPLVPRYLRFDVAQRTFADGSSLEPLDVKYVEKLASELVANGVEAVAISFLHSFVDPSDERAARDAVRRVAPGLRISISSEVSPEIREFERGSTTIANVYVQARVERYLSDLQARLKNLKFCGTFLLMLSNGGLATSDTAAKFPIRLLESGPAAGALAAVNYGVACGRRDLVSFDMGGTTAKFCVIDGGEPPIAHEFEFDRVYRFKKGSGLPARISAIEMVEIGAGGGSIARVDLLGLLKVGPDSAGAEPGPVCYGRGGSEPTVTDADLVLGYLDPDFFLGGQMKLDLDASRRVIHDRIAAKIDIPLVKAAWGIHQVVNENMANAARVHVLERGKDPRRYPLFAFGGAGPVHGFRIAQALGSPAFIAPLGAGVMSTIGFLVAPLAFDFARSWRAPITGLDWERANALLAEMEAEGRALLEASNVPSHEVRFRREADMRYVGQGYEIPVRLPDEKLKESSASRLLALFEETYRRLYGRLGPPVAIEITNWRVWCSGPKPKLRLDIGPQRSGGVHPQKNVRQVYFPELGGFVETSVFDRYGLAPGAIVEGPAVIEERESTAIIGPHSRGRVDEHWNLIVDF